MKTALGAVFLELLISYLNLPKKRPPGWLNLVAFSLCIWWWVRTTVQVRAGLDLLAAVVDLLKVAEREVRLPSPAHRPQLSARFRSRHAS